MWKLIFGNWKLKLIVVGIIAVLGLIIWVQHVSSDNDKLKTSVREATEENARQNTMIEQQKSDVALMRTINQQIADSFRNSSSDYQRLLHTLQQRNLQHSGEVDPTGTQAQLNADAQFTVRCNEIVTGAPVATGDVNNSVCPELVQRRTQSE